MAREPFKREEIGVQPNGKIKSNGSQLFSVPDTPEGRHFLHLAGKFCNSRKYRVVKHCRKGKKELPKPNSRRWGEYKMDEAEWFAVYLNANYPRRRP